jgi:16S rRNA (cytosine967-C5)-methyltransferase
MTEPEVKSAYGLGRAARLNLAFEILDELGSSGRTLDSIMSSRFKNMAEALERRDRRDLEGRVRSVLLHYRRLLWWLKRTKQTPSVRALLLADMVLNEKSDLDQLQKLCNGARNRMDMLTKDEISALKFLLGKDINHPDMSEAIFVECPDWAEKGLRKVFGDNFADEMRAMSTKAPTDFRVNTLLKTRDEVMASLAEQGVKTEATPYSPIGLRLTESGGPVLSDTKAFKEGCLEPQDEGSQLIALLVGAKSCKHVVDFCAGAGGKTLALAAEMKNAGQLVACDVHSKRLHRTKVRLKRAGIVNTERRQLLNTFDPWVKKNKGKFERVLIDAPCTGTGTWRRNMDSKWSKDESDLAELLVIQKEILNSATRLAKKGGRVIYATCSILPEENEDQINAFLAENDGFKLLKAKDIWQELMEGEYPSSNEDYFRLSPLQSGCDGFFGAILEKI